MANLHSWGERGLVASYFRDVEACHSLSGWTAFLNAISFPLNGRVVQDTWAVIEPDFGNKAFGHPDFIALLSFDREPKQCGFILEAKKGSFSAACKADRGRIGFNSSINGQLELNHRLAIAFASFKAGDEKLVEPDWVLRCPEYSTPSPDVTRYLKNRLILEKIVAKMGGLPLQQYHHVIITGDGDDPRQHIPQELRPRIWRPEGEVVWHDFTSNLYWTNWRSLYEQSATWPVQEFRHNYEFMRFNVRKLLAAVSLPNNRPHAGATLVRLSQAFYAPNPPSNLYLSWKGTNFRLRNFSGAARLDVHLPGQPNLLDLLPHIDFERKFPNRQPYKSYVWWHERTLEANHSDWPHLWTHDLSER